MGGAQIYYDEVLVPIARNGRLEDAWFNYSYSPLPDENGVPEGILVICTEVTREVTTRRQLETANRAKDEFLGTVSHELRTPLTSILGWARILMRADDPERIAKGIAIIDRNARAQAKIIDDILDVSRIISGKLRLSPTPIDVGAVVSNAVESMRPAANAREVRLEVDVSAPAPILADEERLQQIVWNLLSNGVKFTAAGGTVTVSARQNDQFLTLAVRDSGRGISPDFLPYVFDRFRQADGSTTKQHGGLGLGLAIVRHLVELHGGSVRASSEGEGHGAQFEVQLPLRAIATQDDTVADTRSSEAPLAPQTNSPLRALRILVVDDERDAREVVATILEEAGAEVLCADNVSSAIELLASTPVAAIVSDIGMPGEDGYSFLERVRREARTSTIPAVALTAFARAEDRDRAVASGFHEHIAKPIDPARLVAVVVGLVNAAR
jgi:signal transduction histidine kinase/CheY-like chemotaxis protein